MRYQSARQMIFDAYQAQRGSVMESSAEIMRLGARVQHSQKQNNDWRIVHGLEAGSVIARVEALPAHLQAAARLLWGPFTAEELAADRERVHMALVRAMQGQRLPGQGQAKFPPAETWRTLTALAWAAIYHHGETTHPYGRPGLVTPKRIQQWVQEERGQTIDVRRWSAAGRLNWDDSWQRMLTILDDWESHALGAIAELMADAA